jgi:hypothetical protein
LVKILNIHERNLNQPKARVWQLFETLASDNDLVIATNRWPRMKLDNGLNVGSKGGHGSIGYTIVEYKPVELIKFQFTKPSGFYGFHKFEITEVAEGETKLKHTIDMETSLKGYLLWTLAIRSLHDAFMEDAFDKVENHFTKTKKVSEWRVSVKFLRKVLSRRKSA